PQLVENIGMTARAMMNCGLSELRLVTPRDPWPLGDIHTQRMLSASSGANEILQTAKVFETVDAALADLNYIYATTSRAHDMVNRILTASAASTDMVGRARDGQRIGVMFGPERTGLLSDHVALANARITIPLNPDFASLNLAQAVLLVGYEWYQAQVDVPAEQLRIGHSRPATQDEYRNFYRRLEAMLDERGFFVAEDMRPAMTRSLQNMLQRAAMTEQEIRTWHGVLTALATSPKTRPEPTK
ncbi:MAG: RNA methyltransferase, partial [Pseudomonadota bacterium]|nr:RNA methyltransferase [Pseudomonadota bacterium]